MNGKKRIMARWFIIAGLILVVVGLVLYFAPGVLHWFGRLPGDIRIENEQQQGIYPYHLHGAGQHFPDRCGEPDQVAAEVKERQKSGF